MALPDILQTRTDTLGSHESISANGLCFGIYYPSRKIVNAELTQSGLLKTKDGKSLTDDDVLRKTGVEHRFAASSKETPAFMAFQAALPCVINAGWKIDAFVNVGSFPQGYHQADRLAEDFQIETDATLRHDHYAACSSGPFALTYLLDNEARFRGKRVLITGAESYQRHLPHAADGEFDPNHPETIFSDGGAAFSGVYGGGFQPIGYVNFDDFTDEQSKAIAMPIDYGLVPSNGRATAIRIPHPRDVNPTRPDKFYMNGSAVMKILGGVIPGLIADTMRVSGLREDPDAIFLHQASLPVLSLIKRGLPQSLQDKVYIDLAEGNWSGVSTFKSLAKAMQEGRVQPGNTVILGGFGAGLFASIVAVRIGDLPLAA